MTNSPFVSIVIPCRNEEEFIAKCLDSVIANDYPKDTLEVLVVDAMSEDGTREVVDGYAHRYPFVRLLDNHKKITPVALNIGIKHAKSQIIMRMDAHAAYEKEYISKCVQYLNEYNADNVGGIWKIVPRDDTTIGKAIALVLSHPFGIGNAYYRFATKKLRWVDTVPFFCYRKEIFDKVGLFNENLTRSQDMEFNLRLKSMGYRTLLVPDIVSYYYARSDFGSFCRHNLRNGVWAIYPLKFTTITPVSWRHMVPLAFVLSLIGSGVLSVVSPIFLYFFLFISGSYTLANLFFSIKIAAEQKNSRYLFLMPLIFTILHISYGLGSLWGLLKVMISAQFWKNRFSSLGANRK